MTTAFVLSGGGFLGAVQVGMLQALEELGIRTDLLVGTSAGAVNAAYVAGRGMNAETLTDLASVWVKLRRQDVSLRTPSATSWPCAAPRSRSAPTRASAASCRRTFRTAALKTPPFLSTSSPPRC